MPITGSVEAMLRTPSERMGLDFPLADLLADEPGRSFLDGIVMATKVGEVTLDGYIACTPVAICFDAVRPLNAASNGEKLRLQDAGYARVSPNARTSNSS
jgi:hypothetical protein